MCLCVPSHVGLQVDHVKKTRNGPRVVESRLYGYKTPSDRSSRRDSGYERTYSERSHSTRGSTEKRRRHSSNDHYYPSPKMIAHIPQISPPRHLGGQFETQIQSHHHQQSHQPKPMLAIEAPPGPQMMDHGYQNNANAHGFPNIVNAIPHGFGGDRMASAPLLPPPPPMGNPLPPPQPPAPMFHGGGGGPVLGGRFDDMRDDFGPPPTFGMPPRHVDGHFEPGFPERQGPFENHRGDIERPPAMGHPPQMGHHPRLGHHPHMGHMGPPHMGQKAPLPPGVQRRNTTGGRPGNSVRYGRSGWQGDRLYGNSEW